MRTLHSLRREDNRIFGNKAANLGELCAIGVNVPPGFVLPAPLDALGLDGSDPTPKSERTYSPSNSLTGGHPHFDEDHAQAILRAFDDLSAPRVSVRSSATSEDSIDRSFAGVFETFLNVRREHLLGAISSCLSSVDSVRTLAYMKGQNAAGAEARMAVIVQKFIASEVSGVCFTRNPVNGDDREVFIEAAIGLGESLVGGRVTPDCYVYRTDIKRIVSKHIVPQLDAVWFDGHEIEKVQLHGQDSTSQKLPDKIISEVSLESRRIADHFGHPQDIEFCAVDGRVFFLQSRSITA